VELARYQFSGYQFFSSASFPFFRENGSQHNLPTIGRTGIAGLWPAVAASDLMTGSETNAETHRSLLSKIPLLLQKRRQSTPSVSLIPAPGARTGAGPLPKIPGASGRKCSPISLPPRMLQSVSLFRFWK
jgi:hypothetical protein